MKKKKTNEYEKSILVLSLHATRCEIMEKVEDLIFLDNSLHENKEDTPKEDFYEWYYNDVSERIKEIGDYCSHLRKFERDLLKIKN